MRRWLIKFLGCRTQDEFQALDIQLEVWRGRAIAAETSVALFKEIMERDAKRMEKLEEKYTGGYLRQGMANPQPPGDKPLGNGIASWPRIKRQMERDHRVKEGPPTKEEVHAQISGSQVEEEVR